jgi:hypothetical protein
LPFFVVILNPGGFAQGEESQRWLKRFLFMQGVPTKKILRLRNLRMTFKAGDPGHGDSQSSLTAKVT